MTPAELERRRPLWAAMSDLFLDTEVRWSVPALARACAASGYDDEVLERIFWVEVFPEAVGNLLSVAGEWAVLSLDEAALVKRAHRDRVPWLARRASGWLVERPWRATRALAPWLAGPEGEHRLRALFLLGHRYFEAPGVASLMASPERLAEVSPALLHEAWARYAPWCRAMLTDDETASHEARAAEVTRLLPAR